MPFLTYRCGQCDGHPTFESVDRLCPKCKTLGIQQTANPSNNDASQPYIDAKPATPPITAELTDFMEGVEYRHIPSPDLTSPISGWCGKSEDRGN